PGFAAKPGETKQVLGLHTGNGLPPSGGELQYRQERGTPATYALHRTPCRHRSIASRPSRYWIIPVRQPASFGLQAVTCAACTATTPTSYWGKAICPLPKRSSFSDR